MEVWEGSESCGMQETGEPLYVMVREEDWLLKKSLMLQETCMLQSMKPAEEPEHKVIRLILKGPRQLAAAGKNSEKARTRVGLKRKLDDIVAPQSNIDCSAESPIDMRRDVPFTSTPIQEQRVKQIKVTGGASREKLSVTSSEEMRIKMEQSGQKLREKRAEIAHKRRHIEVIKSTAQIVEAQHGQTLRGRKKIAAEKRAEKMEPVPHKKAQRKKVDPPPKGSKVRAQRKEAHPPPNGSKVKAQRKEANPPPKGSKLNTCVRTKQSKILSVFEGDTKARAKAKVAKVMQANALRLKKAE